MSFDNLLETIVELKVKHDLVLEELALLKTKYAELERQVKSVDCYYHVTKQGERIPYSDLTNAHIFNILIKTPPSKFYSTENPRSNSKLLLEELLKRNFGIFVTLEELVRYGACKEGVDWARVEFGHMCDFNLVVNFIINKIEKRQTIPYRLDTLRFLRKMCFNNGFELDTNYKKQGA